MKKEETWREIAAKANDIIDKARYGLEEDDQGYGESQYLRGRIAAAREILAVLKPKIVASKPIKLAERRDRPNYAPSGGRSKP